MTKEPEKTNELSHLNPSPMVFIVHTFEDSFKGEYS